MVCGFGGSTVLRSWRVVGSGWGCRAEAPWFLGLLHFVFCFLMGPFSSAPAKASFAASSPPLHLGFRVTTRSCPIHPIIKEYCLTYLGLYAMI